jgi:hypothetical protein
LAQVHAPSQSACWLLTHRFKPTKIAYSGAAMRVGDAFTVKSHAVAEMGNSDCDYRRVDRAE